MKNWNKLDNRYNDDGFFNLSGYMDLVGFNWKNNLIMLINCERNNGKSVGGWKYIEQEIWEKHDYKWKILYCRTTLEQLDKARKDFNIAYKNKYFMTTSHIFKVKIDKKDGKELLNERIEIGAIAAISTQINNKSMRFDNYHYIFWDEYNDIINRIGIYGEFTNLVKSVQRFTKPFAIVLIGNKDNANNEFMVKWGIEIDESDDDTIIFVESFSKENIKVFIDVGKKTFKHLDQKTGLANELALSDYSMNRYLNESGYRNSQHIDVINYDLRIKESAKPQFYLLTKKCKFEIGKFVHHKNGESTYIRMVENGEQLLELRTFTSTQFESMNESTSIVLEKDESYQILESIYKSARNKKLFYTSFDAKIIMEMWYAYIYRFNLS